MLDTILLIVVIVAVFGAVFYLRQTLQRLQDLKDSQQNDKGVIMLNQNLQSMSERIDKTTATLGEKLDKTTLDLNNRLTEAARVTGAVLKELGTVQERFKGFEEFNELLHPKMRGNIGEEILGDMLAQVFPKQIYEMQYKFKDGSTVDAIIRTAAGIIPVDSKFPLENFKQLTRATTEAERVTAGREFVKAVKKHIDDISRKYLLPEEGTVNFAIMYIPSENVYYQMLTDDENTLLDYAKKKNVLVTSPHGLFNFLRVILMGLERARLQEQAQKIWDILKGVQQESVRFGEDLGVLARHITNAKGSMDQVQSHFTKLSGKLDQVNLLEAGKAAEGE